MNPPKKNADRPLRVLLIDGKRLDACMMEERLQGRQELAISVEHGWSLDRGLACLQAQTPDLVLLDPSIEGPGRNRTVRAVVAAASPAPVVILAARHDDEAARRYLRMGVQDFVAKGEVGGLDVMRVLCHAVERQRVVTALEEARRRAEHLASHDALTGLPQRALFVDRLRQALATARRHGGLVAVLYVDLNGFKRVNDTLGHDVGDRLLVGVAERLSGAVRASDTVARFGGDEFVVLGERIETPADARAIAASLRRALAAPISIGRYRLRARPSIGIALSPNDGTRVDDLLRKADGAMYRDKRNSRVSVAGGEASSHASS